MTIITTVGQTNYHHESYAKRLADGEYWEDRVCQLIRDAGLNCDRYRQPELPEKDRYKYPMFQRDAYIWLPWGRVNLEIKSRSGNPFNWTDILVGKRSCWDRKRYKTHFLAVVSQQTGEVRVTRADVPFRRKYWKAVSNFDPSYSVLRKWFMPLDKLILRLKEDRPTDNHWSNPTPKVV